MQKIEILIDGPDQKKCAEMTNDLANTTMKHHNVIPVNIYCGTAPVKKNFIGFQVPSFMSRNSVGEKFTKTI